MSKKTFRLSEEAVACIKKIQEENHLKTETSAVEFVLKHYCKGQAFESVLEKVLEEKLGSEIKSLIKMSRAEEEKIDLLLDGMNSQLIHFAVGRLEAYDKNPASILIQARKHREDKIKELQIRKNYEQTKGK